MTGVNDHEANSGIIEIALGEAFQHRPVNTQIFTPFLIARLMEHPATIERSLDYQVILQNIDITGARTLAVKWTWTDIMVPPVPLAAQHELITELAAYAMAFACLSRFTSATLISVAE